MIELLGCSTTQEVFLLDYQTMSWYSAAKRQQSKAFVEAFEDDGFAQVKDLLIKSNHSHSIMLGIDLRDYNTLP